MMTWKPTRIGVRGRGPSVCDGSVAVCTGCGNEQWMIFALGDGKAPHAQCTGCGAVYCLHPDECEAFDTYEPTQVGDADTVYPDPDDRR